MKKLPAPLELLNVSQYHQAPGVHPVPRRIIRYHECIELVTAGRGWVMHEEAWVEVGPGDLVWNLPGQRTIGRSDFADPYQCLAVVFRVGSAGGRPLPRFSQWPELDEVQRFASEVREKFLDERFDRRVLMHFLNGALMYRVHQHELIGKVRRYSTPVRLALAAIDLHFSEQIRIPEIARQSGVSEPHLYEVFRNQVGVTPHQWLIRRRLRAAKEHLVNTSDSVKQTAHACGFGNSSAFVHAFKQAIGQTPAVFRAHYFPGEQGGSPR